MLLEASDVEKNAGSGPPGTQGDNGAALENSTSRYSTTMGRHDDDNESVVSSVAEPVDRMTMLEQSNHRIESMLGQLMHGGGGSPPFRRSVLPLETVSRTARYRLNKPFTRTNYTVKTISTALLPEAATTLNTKKKENFVSRAFLKFFLSIYPAVIP